MLPIIFAKLLAHSLDLANSRALSSNVAHLAAVETNSSLTTLASVGIRGHLTRKTKFPFALALALGAISLDVPLLATPIADRRTP